MTKIARSARPRRYRGNLRIIALAVILSASTLTSSARAGTAPPPPGHEQIARAFDLIVEHHLDPVDPAELAMRGYAGLMDEAARTGGTAVPRRDVRGKDDLLAAFDSLRPIDEAARRKLVGGALSGMVLLLRNQNSWDDTIGLNERRAQRPLGALGVSVALQDGGATIMAVLLGLPASQAGIRRGDRLVAIDGAPVAGRTLDDIMARLGGEPNSPVALRIERDGKTIDFPNVVRNDRRAMAPVRTRSIGSTLYIRIDSMAGFETGARVKTAIRSLSRQKPLSAILDLRANAGGLLEQVVAVADLFLPAGPIGQTRGRTKSADQTFVARSDDVLKGVPLVVLVDDNTANGAELLTAALVENGRATSVGTPTMGQGLVRTLIELGDEFVLTLATEALLTSRGKPIEGHPQQPTVVASEAAGDVHVVPGEPGKDPQLDYALGLLSPVR